MFCSSTGLLNIPQRAHGKPAEALKNMASLVLKDRSKNDAARRRPVSLFAAGDTLGKHATIGSVLIADGVFL